MKEIKTLIERKQIARERSNKWYKDFGHLDEVKDKRKVTLLNWKAKFPNRYLCQQARSRANLMKQDATPEELNNFAQWIINQSIN